MEGYGGDKPRRAQGKKDPPEQQKEKLGEAALSEEQQVAPILGEGRFDG